MDPALPPSATTAPYKIAETLELLAEVEKTSVATAQRIDVLMHSLRKQLMEISDNTVDHVELESDAAAALRVSALSASNQGMQFIDSCRKFADHEANCLPSLATQTGDLRRRVDELEVLVNKLTSR